MARYLAKLEGRPPSTTRPDTTAVKKTTELTGVDKYLAKSSRTLAEKPQAKPEAQPKPIEAESVSKAEITEDKAASVKTTESDSETSPEAKAETKKRSVTPAKKTSAKIIDLAEHAVRCQAATQKGSQCRRKSGLEVLEKTIDKQKYKFAVCSQHHNDAFTPFAQLLKND
nr:hypothetical protein [Methylomarinum sp. Ch1-1]MDP4521861.1 hypothetical protein [Methylomarinum sp. Ch1-1]